MTKENFNRIMAGLEEARRHAAGEDVPGMVIHRPPERSMINRVADALQAHQLRHGPDYEGLARIAIDAMRGATEPMIASGIACAENCTDGWTAAAPCVAEHCWDAMIDAALRP